MTITDVPTCANLVGGRWVPPGEGGHGVSRNPADPDEVVGDFPAMTAAEAAAAVQAAVAAAPDWRRTSPVARGLVLRRIADVLEGRTDSLARLVAREIGKTPGEAAAEVAKTAEFFRYYGSLGRGEWGRLLAHEQGGTDVVTRREPVGVVTAITPWNDPLLTPARKLAPALVCGNTAVLKPASDTAVSGLAFARALHDAGVPAGVLNTVTGRSAEVAGPLLDPAHVRAVAFTGSTAVGRALERQVAGRGVRIQAELGGKNSSVVLADADLDLAVDTVVAAAFAQAGQRCTATSRLIVQRERADELVERLTGRVAALRVGPPDDPDAQMGPLVSGAHLHEVHGHVERARDQGARVLCGGALLHGGRYRRGHFLQPTVLDRVGRGFAAWREEIFGPVLAVTVVDSLDAAIELAGDGTYGLAAAVFTDSMRAAHRFATEVRCGQVAVNTATSGWDVHLPFGGIADSGSGFKEQGAEGTDFYTTTKTVALRWS